MAHSPDDRFQQLRAKILKALQARLTLLRQDLISKHPELADRLNLLFEEINVTPRVNDSDAATLLPGGAGAANSPDVLATLPPASDEASVLDARYAPTVFPNAEFAATGNRRKGTTTEPDLTPASSSPGGTRVRYFGDYELLSEIARGGMGVVYKARQVNLNRIVALKMILSGQLASDEDIRRFHTEAESAAHLDHPGIVPIHEIGEHDGQHYFSMGFVDGKSLADRVKDGPLPPQEAASLTRKISEAIAYAHEKGVIHRDLKPANVLLDAGGEPKVTDFGLARKLEQDSGLTRTGAVMGTPSYMPPEQAAGETDKVGPLADVYSLGAMLYCLLTGRPPFQAANPLDTLLQVMEREPIAPTELAPTIPKDLETICLKCLQKDRLKRYESANNLAADIGRWERGEPIRARAVTRMERVYRWIKRNRVVSGLLTATAVGLVLATGFGVQAGREAANARAAELQAKTAEQQATESEQQARATEATAVAAQQKTEATLARSNYFLAQARWDDNRVSEAFDLLHAVPQNFRNIEWHLTRRQFDQSQFSCWGHTAGVKSVSFSPDGTRIASASLDRTIKIWDALTGTEITTLNGHEGECKSVSFSPDGTRIASASSDRTIKIWDAWTGMEITTLNGHTSVVTSVSFSPDGTRIVSASWDKTVRIWDASTGTEITTLNGHEGGVESVNFSPDGTRIASGSRDFEKGEIKIWDSSTGTELTTLKGHEGSVTSVSFSPNGTRIASGGFDRTIKIWDASTGTEITTLNGHEGSVTSVSFSPDGTRLASASWDNTVRIWDVSTSTEITTPKGHEYPVESVSFSPDGTRIASASYDNTVKIWDASTGTEITTLKGHEGEGESVSFSPNGTRVASGSSDRTIKIWDVSTGTEITTLKGHEGSVTSLSFSPDGTRIASASYDNTVKIWDASTGTEITTLNGHESEVFSVSFSPDGTRIASGSQDKTVKIWDALTGTEITTLNGHTERVRSVSFSPDGTRIASGGFDRTIKIWDASTGTEITTLKAYTGLVTSVSFSPNGTRIAWGGTDGIQICDASTGTEITTLKGHKSEVFSVSFSPDGTRIASGSQDKTVKIWDALTGTELTTLKDHTSVVTSVSFSPDGTRIASASWDKTVRIWDASTATEITPFNGHEGEVESVSFSPDGTRLASGSYDQTIKIWDASTGTELTTFRGHTSLVTSVSFSPDGTRIASSSRDKTVRIWDALTGTELTTVKGHEGSVTSVSFSPDGTRLASGSDDQTIKIWDASTGTEITTLNGHEGSVTSVSFSPDGTRLLSTTLWGEQLFWDLRTGNVLSDDKVEQFSYSGGSERSPDGRWLAVRHGNEVWLVDLTFMNTPREKLRREALARPKPRWHREQSLAAQSAMQWYPCTFHLAWLLKINLADGWAYDDLHEAHRKLLATNNEQAPPLPSIVSEMLKQPRGSELPQLTDDSVGNLHAELWNLVITPATGDSTRVSSWHLQRIQDICGRYPQAAIAKITLGVMQYRLSQFDTAIGTLRKSLETSGDETDPSGPNPVALAFLALCHHQLGQTEPATQFRQQLNDTVQQETWVLEPVLQSILVEVQSVFDGADSVRAAGTLDDFNREAGFEGLSQHRWRFGPDADNVKSSHGSFRLSNTVPHTGMTSLSLECKGTRMASQTVTVSPQSHYRLTGWILTKDVISDPVFSTPSPADGVSLGILPVDVSPEWTTENGSAPIVGTTEWTQVTFEFQTGESTTMQIGCRSRNCTGTAWFDDLHLEKLE